MIKNFSVPDPCHESWQNMLPQQNGRYCGSCQKVVVDFTNKTNQEILDYINANSGKKMCGTFKKQQLPQIPPPPHHEKSIRFLAALLLVFGMTLFSCNSVVFGDKESVEEIKSEKCYQTTGIMIIEPDTVPASDKIVSQIQPVTGVIAAPELVITEPYITGDMVLPDEEEHDTIKVRKEDIVLGIVDQMPEFKEGGQSLQQYIQLNLKFPNTALEEDIKGTVYVTFVVKKDGSINDVKLLRGIHPDCDAEALRVIRNMPDWKPGKNKGELANVQVNIPIKFLSK
ncbi:MAG TPA: energy transducer TonB [Bacteroidia bacterium]|jgi:TonB family protein